MASISTASAHEGQVICRYCTRASSQLPRGRELEGRYQYAPARQVDVLHVKIDVTPDFDARTVTGTTTIRAKVIAKPCRILRLDAVDLHVSDVRCVGATIEDFYATRDDIKIAFQAPVPADEEITLEIDYSAEPESGLYFRTPAMGYPESDTHLWTQGEPHGARHWFPCFDYPNERSSTEIICRVPSDMTVLGNGEKVEEREIKDGLKSVRWIQSKPHVIYLVCLVAGKLERIQSVYRDIELGFYTQPSLAEYAPNSFVDTADVMACFEKEIGIPFPWFKYDQVTCADFVAGGMENTTLTTLTQGTIFSKKTENLKTSRRLVAHELAHQWFGDYVTCKDWSHLWLNEGFATYYTHLYEGHRFGPDAMRYGLWRDARSSIFPRVDDTKPIVYNEYGNPMEQFDYRAYPKGSWVLHMLRSQLGEDLYRKSIKSYLETHALGSVTSEDLRQTFERFSGRPLDRFFDQWVYHARHPQLKIAYQWMANEKLAKVTIEQTQKIDDDGMKFEFPTTLRFVVKDQAVDHPIEVKEKKETFYVPLDGRPKVVRFDPEFTVLADVSFKKPDDLLFAQLKAEDDMIGRLMAAQALAERKTHASVSALQSVVNSDSFFGVRMAAVDSLVKIGTDEALSALKEGWQNQKDARVRNRIVSRLASRYDDSTLEFIESVLDNEANPGILATAIRALGPYQSAETEKTLIRFLNTPSFRNELADAAISAMGQQAKGVFRKPLIETLQTQEKQFTSRSFGRALVTLAELSRPHEKNDKARRFLTQYVNHPRSGIQTGALKALGILGSPKSRALLESFTDQDNSKVKDVAQAALDSLQEQTPMVPQEVISLRKELQTLKQANEKLNSQWKTMQDQWDARLDPKKSKQSSQSSQSKTRKDDKAGSEKEESPAKPDAPAKEPTR